MVRSAHYPPVDATERDIPCRRVRRCACSCATSRRERSPDRGTNPGIVAVAGWGFLDEPGRRERRGGRFRSRRPRTVVSPSVADGADARKCRATHYPPVVVASSARCCRVVDTRIGQSARTRVQRCALRGAIGSGSGGGGPTRTTPGLGGVRGRRRARCAIRCGWGSGPAGSRGSRPGGCRFLSPCRRRPGAGEPPGRLDMAGARPEGRPISVPEARNREPWTGTPARVPVADNTRMRPECGCGHRSVRRLPGGRY